MVREAEEEERELEGKVEERECEAKESGGEEAPCRPPEAIAQWPSFQVVARTPLGGRGRGDGRRAPEQLPSVQRQYLALRLRPHPSRLSPRRG